ncbi:MAG: hypothetical protein COB66_02625 [Coxiella sp. (in: Bacteria)]|nr:MAG: hypothetical protein COB66_02625 [Coxiella sp. (in: g-proteobacteria)]
MRNKLTKFFLRCGLGLFKIIPFWLLYRLSDGLYYLLYYVLRIRRKVVRNNIQFAFPDKPLAERILIEKKSYRNFCDVILESVKGFSMTPQQLAKRYLTPPGGIDHYFEEKKSVVAFMAHFNNWEWGTSIQLNLKHKAFFIYKRLHNRGADELIRQRRAACGAELIYKEQVARTLIRNRRTPSFYAVIADQRPSSDQEQRTVTLFNRQITCFAGPEMIAKTFGMVVLYSKIERIKRGYYRASPVVITEDPKNTEEGYISQQCFSLLEAQIREHPGHWMWMHKRFKGLDRE